ncbi:MAG: glycosyltransferase family 2 protein [Alphaproteobacteria bacterium]|nr:glycosyltransferase family 2 protein [Alphaproteobacteria bacterium]
MTNPLDPTPLLSVIIPAYNVERYVLECVHSVLGSSVQDLEVLVFVDACTDNTGAKVTSLDNHRVRVFHSAVNRGPAYGRNRLFEQARGRFIALVDADDIVLPDRFSAQLGELERRDLIAVGCGMIWQPAGHIRMPVTGPKRVREVQMQGGKAIMGPTLTFRREVLDTGLRYDEDLRRGEDRLFEARIQERYPLRTDNVPQALYHYRRHAGSLMATQRQVPAEVRRIDAEVHRRIMAVFGKPATEPPSNERSVSRRVARRRRKDVRRRR